MNNIGPTRSIIKFTRASEVHNHLTRHAAQGNLYSSWVRTTRFGLKNLQNEGGDFWDKLPNNIKDSKSKRIFVTRLIKYKFLNNSSL